MNNTINVSLAFDNKYLPYAYVTLYSVFVNNPNNHICAYILQYDLSDASKSHLNLLASRFNNSIFFLDVSVEFIKSQLPDIGRWRTEAYFRLLIPELLPPSVNRIIYIDSDIIVNSSLSELYSTDISAYDLAGCYDLNIMHASLDVFLQNRHESLADSFSQKTYVNSGMLLLNVDRMRNFRLSNYLDAFEELEYKIFAPDQDLINYVHRDSILLLDPRKYNYPGYIAYLEGKTSNDLKESTSIVHFVGEKPWTGGDHAHFPTETLWWDYALQTIFKDALCSEYIYNTMNDLTIFQYVQGIDTVRNSLYEENIRLKKELDNASMQIKQVLSMLGN